MLVTLPEKYTIKFMKILQECDKMMKHQIKIKIEIQKKPTEGSL